MDQNITSEAKINYIYETMRKQESRYKWGMTLKWMFRIGILVYIYIFAIYMLPSIIENLKTSLTPQIPALGEIDMSGEDLLKMAREYFNKK